MITKYFTPKEFNPDTIINSGQVFRFHKEFNMYYVYSGNMFMKFNKGIEPYSWEFYTTENDWKNFWEDYFDFKTDYSEYNRVITNSGDSFLVKALEKSPGLRILKQDLWEVLISFIISQQNNIPKITKSIWNLCHKFGVCVEDTSSGCTALNFHFPTAVKLSDLSVETLSDGTLLGYRAKYILRLAQAVSAGEFDLNLLLKLSPEESKLKLLEIYGVGEKVSSCVELYGLHHMESYPIDVWMKRIIEQDYSEYATLEYMNYVNENYDGFQGYVQQLQFMYKRLGK